MKRVNLHEAASLLMENDRFVIVTHANPDGDTLGSGFGLLRALKKLGKTAKLVNEKPIPENFSFISAQSDDFDSGETVIAVDIADKKLMGELEEKYADRTLLCIDHHPSNTGYAQNLLLFPEAAAACEVVFLLIKELGVEIDSETATALYTGISTDTGCFRYSNVTADTHRYAGELIERGADHVKSDTLMFETKSMSYFVLQRMALEKMEVLFGGKVAVVSLTKKMFEESGADESCADAIKSIPRQIEGVAIGVTLREDDDVFHVSLRTHAPYDASEICRRFGGGGHARAAGCEMKLSEEKTKQELINVLKEYFQ